MSGEATFLDLDYSGFKLPIIVVYWNPLDYPLKYVARLWNVDEPTDYNIIRDSLGEIRREIPEFFVHLDRQPDDDPVIVETWL